MIGFKIEYTVDNWSNILSLEEWGGVKTKMSGVYFLYNSNKEIIYIGKTTVCIRQRINCHCFQNIEDSIMYIKKHELNRAMELRSETVFFSYIKTEKLYSEPLEIVLISKFKPKYNRKICI